MIEATDCNINLSKETTNNLILIPRFKFLQSDKFGQQSSTNLFIESKLDQAFTVIV